MNQYVAEQPWEMPKREECYFYHTFDYGSERVEGTWTIGDFNDYIGGYDLRNKTVLDVGTASGFLTFHAERRGARVTAIDLASMGEIRYVPFASSLAFQNRSAWVENLNRESLIPMKKSWWYGWHKFNSQAEVYYMPIDNLMEWDRSFDVVIAGAIVEHISDPIFSIGAWAKVAKEAVLIPFTTVIPTDDLVMRPITPWTDASYSFAWWELSRGLYERVFDNLGFDVEFEKTTARFSPPQAPPINGTRPSLIARRRTTRV
jgi:2-polyprenyl-3-methyl-5-hydroxy-6-metoxy-1,4-benzoquinol methylase